MQMSWWLKELNESLCHLARRSLSYLENKVMRMKCQIGIGGVTVKEVEFLVPAEQFSLFCAL